MATRKRRYFGRRPRFSDDDLKKCPRCERAFRRGDFPACGKTKDGRIRRHAYCAECKRADEAERRAIYAKDERQRERKRRNAQDWYRRQMADPVLRARLQRKHRERQRRRRASAEGRERVNAASRAHRRRQRATPRGREKLRQQARTRRARIKEDPERLGRERERQRRDREERMRDPVKRERDRQNRAIAYRLRRERAGFELTGRTHGTPRIDREGGGLLRVAPLVEFLEQYRRDTALSIEDLCAKVDIDPRQLWAWQNGEIESVQHDTADRVVTRLGMPYLLFVLWPELDEEVA